MSELSAEGVLSNPFCVGCIAQINFLVGNETFVGAISVLIEFAVALHAACCCQRPVTRGGARRGLEWENSGG